jgi:hypothetical protein
MMAVAYAYGLAMKSILNKEVDFDSDTVKCLLLKSTYTPNQDTHQYKSDLVCASNEVTGTGYTATGVTLGTKTVTYTAGTNTLMLDSADPAWTALTVTGIRYAVFYVVGGSEATSPLLSYLDFGSDQSPVAQNFTIVLPVTGIIQFVV